MVRRFRRYRPEKIVHMESVTDTVIPISPPRLCEPELLVAAEPAGAGQFISGMWVGLTWLNIAQLLLSAHCAAG